MKIIKTLVTSLLLGALLISCAPGTGIPVDAEYILTTDLRDGKFVYVGVNENISGVVNPTLQAKPGEKITITFAASGRFA